MTTTEAPALIPIQTGWKRGEPRDQLLLREWLITNALGGYASGTIGGANTRRFHGFLIAALPAPLGRTMMFNHLEKCSKAMESAGVSAATSTAGAKWPSPRTASSKSSAIENGKPVWRFAMNGMRIEKRVLMPHLQNTSYVVYRLLEGPAGLRLRLRPSLHFRPHEGLVADRSNKWQVSIVEDGSGSS